MKAEFDAWLGVPMDTLQIVYHLNGHESQDSRMGVTEHWTQRHNPYLGKSVPQVLMRKPPPSVSVFFASSFVNRSTGCLVVTAAPGSDDEDPGAMRFLKDLMAEFKPEDVFHLQTALLIGDEVPCKLALRLTPNTFSLDTPYTCCVGHAVISYAASVLKERGPTDLPWWFRRPLQDVEVASKHTGFFDYHHGRRFRKLMLPLHTVMLQDTLRRVMKNKPGNTWNHQVLDVFLAAPKSALRVFFSTDYLVVEVFSFFNDWIEAEPMRRDVVICHLRRMLLDVVPFDLRGRVLDGVRDYLDMNTFDETAQIALARCMLEHNAGVRKIVRQAVGKCWFATTLVCEFSGLAVSTDAITGVLDICRGALATEFYFPSNRDKFLVDMEAIRDDYPLQFGKRLLPTPRVPFDSSASLTIQHRLRLLRLNVSPLKYFNPQCLLTHRHNPVMVWSEADLKFEEYIFQLVLAEGIPQEDLLLDCLGTFFKEFQHVLATDSAGFEIIELMEHDSKMHL